MEGRYMIVETICGKVKEKSQFAVGQRTKAHQKLGRRDNRPVRPRREDNQNSAIRRLNRVFNCNFTHGDYLLTLKYDVAGMERIGGDRKEGERQMRLFIRRFGRKVKTAGSALRWVAMTSELDGDTGEVVRLHHHLVVSGDLLTITGGDMYVAGKKLDDVWGFGSVDWQPIRTEDDHIGLAVYLCKQSECKADAKTWTTSRNLKKPIVRERIVTRKEPLSVPRKAIALEVSQYNRENGTHYIRYRTGGHIRQDGYEDIPTADRYYRDGGGK